jgi:hypothetical protein
MCSGDGERLPMNFVTEDAESEAQVKVGSNNQNPTASKWVLIWREIDFYLLVRRGFFKPES